MRIRTSKLLLALGLAVAFSSCQKEINLQPGTGGTGGTFNAGDIVGDYDFVGMVAHTQSTVTVTDQGQELKSVTTSDYATKQNVGTVKITTTDLVTNGFGYSIDTVMNVKTYVNNVLFDDSDFPFVATAAPTSGSWPYSRVSADSITVIGAFGVADPSGVTPTGPVGLKLSWSGDTLLMRVVSTFTQNVNQNGVPALYTGSVVGVTKLKKH